MKTLLITLALVIIAVAVGIAQIIPPAIDWTNVPAQSVVSNSASSETSYAPMPDTEVDITNTTMTRQTTQKVVMRVTKTMTTSTSTSTEYIPVPAPASETGY